MGVRGWQKSKFVLWAALAASGPVLAGERLDWTGGVNEIEGAGGGGLVPWALIAGLGTADETGGSAFVTGAETRGFSLKAAGVAVGVHDRLEASFARQDFGIGSVVPGSTLGQDIAGLKVRVAGDAVFDQDRLLPQLAIGAFYKRTRDFDGVPRALGARDGSGVDLYLAATKVFLDGIAGHRVLVDLTLRRTDANQYGLLGFGGAHGPVWRAEGSVGVWLADALLAGVEWRGKSGALAAPPEGDAADAFLAWQVARHVTLVAAYVDLGPVVFPARQRGAYLSVSFAR